MLAEFHTVFDLMKEFLMITVIGVSVLSIVAIWNVRKLSIGDSRIAWYGVLLRNDKGAIVLLAMLCVRFFYLISFLEMVKKMSLIHYGCYFAIELVVTLCMKNLLYGLYQVGSIAATAGMIYLYSLLFSESKKIEVRSGVQVLYKLFGGFIVLMAVIQFMIAIAYWFHGTIRNKREKTESDRVIHKMSICMLLLCVCSVALPFYSLRRKDYILLKNGGYQIVDGVHKEYKKNSRVYRENAICVIEDKEIRSELEDTPLYFYGENKICFTKTLSIVRPKLEMTNRVNKLNTIVWDSSGYRVQNGDKSVNIENFFLFDGRDTYYFPKDTVISWGDHSLTVKSFCQVYVKYNQIITLYDVMEDEIIQESIGPVYCFATLKGKEQINLSTDILYRKGSKEQMLFMQPSLLTDIE